MKESARKMNKTTACDFTITNIVLRSHSQGHVRLNSKDFREPPTIDPNYLSDDRDLNILVDGNNHYDFRSIEISLISENMARHRP